MHVLLNLASLADVIYHYPKNLRIVIFDNEAYESPGGLPTVTAHGADLEGIGKACGIKKSCTVSTVEDFTEQIKLAFTEEELRLIVAKISTGTVETPEMNIDGKRNKYVFAAYIEDTAKKPVLRLRKQSPLINDRGG